MRGLRAAFGDAVRAGPGGTHLLRARHRAAARARRGFQRLYPQRPPIHSPDTVIALSAAPDDDTFITGNGIAARCRYVLNFDALQTNPLIENNWWFCNGEFLEYFFRRLAPNEPFVLFSHNSDRAIDERFLPELEKSRMVAWFAKNAELDHPKLHALPIGIANPRWQHGDQAALKRVRQAADAKTVLFEASYDIGTNELERRYCALQTRLPPTRARSFEEHLRRLASSYFCVSPKGNGIDCHRTWEALYVGTTPIVTRSLLTRQHQNLPMVVLDDWSEFPAIDFSPELYDRLWSGWDAESLRLDRYLERIEKILAGA